jgi:hypothetical protein
MRPKSRRATLPPAPNPNDLPGPKQRAYRTGGPPFTAVRAQRADRARTVLTRIIDTGEHGHLTMPQRRRLKFAFQGLAASDHCDLLVYAKLRSALGDHIFTSEDVIYTAMTRIPALVTNSPVARSVCLSALGILCKERTIDELPPEWVTALAHQDGVR